MSEFVWQSLEILDVSDVSKNNKLLFCFETGIDQSNNNTKSIPPRTTIKIQDLIYNKNKCSISLSLTELNNLYKQIYDFNIGTSNNVKIETFNKNILKRLIITRINKQGQPPNIVVGIKDSSPNSMGNLIMSIDSVTVDALCKITHELINNYITHSIGINNTLNLRIMTDNIHALSNTIEIMNNNIFNIHKYNIATNKQIVEKYPNVLTESVNPLEEAENSLKNSTKEDDVSDINIKYDSTDPNKIDPFIVPLDDIDKFELPEVPENIVLPKDQIETTGISYESKTNSICRTRPFIDSFLKNDIGRLEKFITSINMIDKNSNTKSFKPLYTFLLKNIYKNDFSDLYSNVTNIFEFEGFIIEESKNYVNCIVNNKNYKYKKFMLLTDDKINKYNHTELWELLIDLLIYVSISFNLKMEVMKIKLENDNPNLKFINNNTSLNFINIITSTLVQLIDSKDLNVFKQDVQDVYSYVLREKKDFINIFNNIFSDISKGGKLNINIQKLSLIWDKYIEGLYEKADGNTTITGLSDKFIQSEIEVKRYIFYNESDIDDDPFTDIDDSLIN